ILCCGAKKPRDLKVPGREECRDVFYAVDFLKSATKDLLGGKQDAWTISAKNKRVVIVGGGDTGNDCLGTCIRQGAKSVTQIEMMPKPPLQRRDDNPWPQWPLILKTDYGQLEAIRVFGKDPRIFGTTVKEIITENGKLKAVRTVKVKSEKGALIEIEGSEKEIRCELLIIAAGFLGCEDYVILESAVKQTGRGVVKTEEGQYQTSVPGIFTAGDMHRGQSLVVWAVAEGRHCAAETDAYLMGYTLLT
ncbi:MAG: FAD-dependent oxidoreductase, partial [Eubacterium sp.]|nr:FAD-dependent oxidoreductase [Eubacterium sp.]